MKQIIFIVFIIFAFADQPGAGEIYGFITAGGKPIPLNTEVLLECPKNAIDKAVTDEHGYYRVYVPGEQECIIKMRYGDQNQLLEARVPIYKEAVQFDLVVDKILLSDKKVTYSLRRK